MALRVLYPCLRVSSYQERTAVVFKTNLEINVVPGMYSCLVFCADGRQHAGTATT